MSLIEPLLAEFSHETSLTRKLIERAPEQHFDWKPHAKSMTLRQLVSHLVDAVGWVGATLDLDVLEMDPGTYKPYVAPSRADALSTFDRNVIAAAGRMKGQSDEHLLKHWTMRSGGKTVFTLPRIAVLRTFIINHQIHHRGQLDVYLRLKDVSLPQIYGPTADEPGMFPRN